MSPRTVVQWLLVFVWAMATSLSQAGTAGAAGLLEQGKAFQFDARVADPSHVEVRFDVAPGYYMYREQFKFAVRGATLGAAELPAGHVKFDETFQKNVETYRGRVLIELPITDAQGPFMVSVASQGCSDRGICYPPTENHAQVQLTGADGAPGSVKVLPATPFMPGSEPVAAAGAASPGLDMALSSGGRDTASASTSMAGADGASNGVSATAPLDSTATVAPSHIDAGIESALASGAYAKVIGVFLLAGVLLSLTPCVLPMLPILSSIIVGDEARSREAPGPRPTRSRSLVLAASYSLGMALVYTALGVAAGLAGEGLAAALQQPFILGLFALALAVLALSMFGAYELRLPSAWTGRFAATSGRLQGGRIAGVFLMGGVSALIVSPCVAAPLAGALVYISQTRDGLLGGVALFALAAGMSVPLLVIGASAEALLPRAGAWMEGVKRLFGLLLLGVAIWTVQPVVPPPLVLALWGVLLMFGAVLLGLLDRAVTANAWAKVRKTVAVVAAVFGLIQIVGAASGGTDPLQPLGHLARAGLGDAASVVASDPRAAPSFEVIRTSADLDKALQATDRPVMLDFYADWCVSCKEMEKFTYTDPAVRAKLAGALLLKVDVTRNAPEDRELLRRFNLFGPPGTLFFDVHGREQVADRVIGFQPADRFSETLRAAGL